MWDDVVKWGPLALRVGFRVIESFLDESEDEKVERAALRNMLGGRLLTELTLLRERERAARVLGDGQ